MKTSKRFFPFFFSLVALTVFFSSCSKDKADEPGMISDPASAIQGEYVGTGKLDYLGIMTVENYSGMKIRITKSSNEYAIVAPYKADNRPFFSEDVGTVYKITQSAKGDFLLTSSEFPQSQLNITKAGHLTYSFPYVVHGGEDGYSLFFEGDKQ